MSPTVPTCRAVLRALLRLVALVALALPVRAEISIQWQSSDNGIDPILSDYLIDSKVVTDFVDLIEKNFEFQPPLTLVLGTDEGPDYRSDVRTLRFPYQYLARAVETQAELVESREEALRRAIDVVEFTLYHMLGHAVLNDGSESGDAIAELIATWIMINAWPNGGEQWFEDTLAFSDASQKLDGPLEDYWHAHAVYRQREALINCLVLGADPDRFERLLPAVLDNETRRATCESAWQRAGQQVLFFLDPMLREDAPLRRALRTTG